MTSAPTASHEAGVGSRCSSSGPNGRVGRQRAGSAIRARARGRSRLGGVGVDGVGEPGGRRRCVRWASWFLSGVVGQAVGGWAGRPRRTQQAPQQRQALLRGRVRAAGGRGRSLGGTHAAGRSADRPTRERRHQPAVAAPEGPHLAAVGAGDVHPVAPDGQGQAALRQGHAAVGAAGEAEAGQACGRGGRRRRRRRAPRPGARGRSRGAARSRPPGWSGAGRAAGRRTAAGGSSSGAGEALDGVQPAAEPPRRRPERHAAPARRARRKTATGGAGPGVHRDHAVGAAGPLGGAGGLAGRVGPRAPEGEVGDGAGRAVVERQAGHQLVGAADRARRGRDGAGGDVDQRQPAAGPRRRRGPAPAPPAPGRPPPRSARRRRRGGPRGRARAAPRAAPPTPSPPRARGGSAARPRPATPTARGGCRRARGRAATAAGRRAGAAPAGGRWRRRAAPRCRPRCWRRTAPPAARRRARSGGRTPRAPPPAARRRSAPSGRRRAARHEGRRAGTRACLDRLDRLDMAPAPSPPPRSGHRRVRQRNSRPGPRPYGKAAPGRRHREIDRPGARRPQIGRPTDGRREAGPAGRGPSRRGWGCTRGRWRCRGRTTSGPRCTAAPGWRCAHGG